MRSHEIYLCCHTHVHRVCPISFNPWLVVAYSDSVSFTHTYTETEGIFHLCIPSDKQWAWQNYDPHDACFQLKSTIAYLTAKANISLHLYYFAAVNKCTL